MYHFVMLRGFDALNFRENLTNLTIIVTLNVTKSIILLRDISF